MAGNMYKMQRFAARKFIWEETTNIGMYVIDRGNQKYRNVYLIERQNKYKNS